MNIVCSSGKVPTNTPLDKITGGLETGIITNLYGPAGSGKTNVTICATLATLRQGRKVVYVDTESNFSTERFSQLGGTDDDLKNILFFTPSSWQEQNNTVNKLFDKIKKENIGLIIVDSMVSLYRLEVSDDNFRRVNKQLANQFSVLANVARTLCIPIVVTSQVYTTHDKSGDEHIEITSNRIARYCSKTMIELQRTTKVNQRRAILRRHRAMPEDISIEFVIEEKRLKEVGKFSLFS